MKKSEILAANPQGTMFFITFDRTATAPALPGIQFDNGVTFGPFAHDRARQAVYNKLMTMGFTPCYADPTKRMPTDEDMGIIRAGLNGESPWDNYKCLDAHPAYRNQNA